MPESKFIQVLGSYMHYLDDGCGDPVLFLHGNPTSSVLWRKIISHMNSGAHCIAPDLIGHGRSDKPDISYRFSDHYSYLEAFTEKLELNRITLVLHDWGSVLGFHYAMQHPEKIKGIAFMESMVKPWQWTDLRWDYRLGFKLLRTPFIGEVMIYGMNAFLNLVMPRLTLRSLNRQEIKKYKKPFRQVSSRKPMLIWPREIPINGKPGDVYQVMKDYSRQLQSSSLPKLLLYAEPGAIIDKKTRQWCEANLPNLTMVYVGKGLHYLQEDHPDKIGEALREWYGSL